MSPRVSKAIVGFVPGNSGPGTFWGLPFFWVLLIVAVLFVVAIVAAILCLRKKKIVDLGPEFFFWLETAYLGLLLLIAILYLSAKWGDPRPTLIGGLLPVAVPWFGALGAVMLSLEGVFVWNKKWDKGYNYWHIGRPLFGAALGIVAFFLFVLTVNAASERPEFLTDPAKTGSADFIVYYIVAFLVGYREETFRELIKRATDMIVGPGHSAASPPVVAFIVAGKTQTTIDFGQVVQGNEVAKDVEVHNIGSGALVAPFVELPPPPGGAAVAFRIEQDSLTSGGDVPAGDFRLVKLVFKPPAAGALAARLTVSGKNVAPKSVELKGTGT